MRRSLCNFPQNSLNCAISRLCKRCLNYQMSLEVRLVPPKVVLSNSFCAGKHVDFVPEKMLEFNLLTKGKFWHLKKIILLLNLTEDFVIDFLPWRILAFNFLRETIWKWGPTGWIYMAGRLLNSFIPNRGGRQFLKCSYQDISFVSSGTRSPPESDFDIIENHVFVQQNLGGTMCLPTQQCATNPTTRIPNSSVLLVTKTACAMDLGNRASYHRSAGVTSTAKNSKHEKKSNKKI